MPRNIAARISAAALNDAAIETGDIENGVEHLAHRRLDSGGDVEHTSEHIRVRDQRNRPGGVAHIDEVPRRIERAVRHYGRQPIRNDASGVAGKLPTDVTFILAGPDNIEDPGNCQRQTQRPRKDARNLFLSEFADRIKIVGSARVTFTYR
jgi:hypothetical protein